MPNEWDYSRYGYRQDTPGGVDEGPGYYQGRDWGSRGDPFMDQPGDWERRKGGQGLRSERWPGFAMFMPSESEYYRPGSEFQMELSRQARGMGGPSAAERMLQGQSARTAQAQMSQAASARGVNPALAARRAYQQQSQAQRGLQEQLGALRAQEQAQAVQAYQNYLAQAEQSDLARLQALIEQSNLANQLAAQETIAKRSDESKRIGILASAIG